VSEESKGTCTKYISKSAVGLLMLKKVMFCSIQLPHLSVHICLAFNSHTHALHSFKSHYHYHHQQQQQQQQQQEAR
jgi:hypothetical protein